MKKIRARELLMMNESEGGLPVVLDFRRVWTRVAIGVVNCGMASPLCRIEIRLAGYGTYKE